MTLTDPFMLMVLNAWGAPSILNLAGFDPSKKKKRKKRRAYLRKYRALAMIAKDWQTVYINEYWAASHMPVYANMQPADEGGLNVARLIKMMVSD
jgi:hypothetical protein